MPHAKMLLSDRPSVNSVMGIATVGSDLKVKKLVINPRILVDFGILGIKRGLNGEHDEIRLSTEEFYNKNLDKAISDMADKFGCDTIFALD